MNLLSSLPLIFASGNFGRYHRYFPKKDEMWTFKKQKYLKEKRMNEKSKKKRLSLKKRKMRVKK